jgi:sulfhydrogenase subunit delta
MSKPRIAVHKFASCDGCQLAFLNAGEGLLELAALADVAHFAEAGWIGSDEPVDIAFVEGSISTREDLDRIRKVREQARYLVTIGACATAGGLQALRNGIAHSAEWLSQVYASPEYIQTLPESRPVSAHVKVDLELWGCPVTTRQVLAAARDLLSGVAPVNPGEPVCLECKRRNQVCVLVAKGEPCLGPVTRTGCGALCPAFGRDCYACFGPAELPNTASLGKWFEGLGLVPEAVARRFLFINSAVAPFSDAGRARFGQSSWLTRQTWRSTSRYLPGSRVRAPWIC